MPQTMTPATQHKPGQDSRSREPGGPAGYYRPSVWPLITANCPVTSASRETLQACLPHAPDALTADGPPPPPSRSISSADEHHGVTGSYGRQALSRDGRMGGTHTGGTRHGQPHCPYCPCPPAVSQQYTARRPPDSGGRGSALRNAAGTGRSERDRQAQLIAARNRQGHVYGGG